MAARVMIFAALVIYQVPQICLSDKDDLLAVLSTLDKLVSYYKENYKSLNLDGFFGLRVLEGQLRVLILEHQTSRYKNLSSDVLDHIIKLKQTAESISALALKYVENDDAKYYKEFSTVIASPWMTQHPPHKLKPSLRWEIPQYKLKEKVKLTEDLSDKCMTELMKSDCTISESCAEIMTSRGLTGYSITHQLLWTILGEKMPNCSTTMNKVIQDRGFGNVSSMRLEMCTNNFYEMVAVVEVLMHGKVHESHQDLFLEQQFVCPGLGYYEFLKKDYLHQIISWQFSLGCFGDMENQNEDQDRFEIASILDGYHEGQGQLIPKADLAGFVGNMQIKYDTEDIISNGAIHAVKSTNEGSHNGIKESSKGHIAKSRTARVLLPDAKSNGLVNNSLMFSPKKHKLKQGHINKPEIQVKPGRRLLVEKEMGSGCLSHKTGVAAGALVMYLRYLVVPSDIKWTGQHDLFLSDTRNLLQADIEGQVKLSEEEENDNDEDEEAAVDNIGDYNGDEEGYEEEAGEDADGYNQNEHDYKANPADNHISDNNGIQFGQLRNADNGIINNEDTERDQEDYVNAQKKASSKQKLQTHGQALVNDDVQDQQEDHNYYDDEGETEKGIIKKRKHLTPRPHPPIKIRKKHRENSGTPMLLYSNVQEELSPDQPNYLVILLVSVSPFFILFFFLLKFIQKRRVHIRYHF